MIPSLVRRLVVSTSTIATIITAPSFVLSTPEQCLPPKNCKTPHECCTFKNEHLYKFQMAETRKMRDWFGDPCNSAPYADKGRSGGKDFAAKADDVDQEVTNWLALKTSWWTNADSEWRHETKTDTVKGSTDGVKCTSDVGTYKDTTTCTEFIDGVNEHEGEHRNFCEMLKQSPAAQAKWGDPMGARAIAESERRAHGWEYLTLLTEYEAAKRRCYSAKHKLTPELEQKSRNAVRKAYNSYRKGGGKTCGR